MEEPARQKKKVYSRVLLVSHGLHAHTLYLSIRRSLNGGPRAEFGRRSTAQPAKKVPQGEQLGVGWGIIKGIWGSFLVVVGHLLGRTCRIGPGFQQKGSAEPLI